MTQQTCTTSSSADSRPAYAIAPILARHYRKVTLVDLRHVQRQYVLDHVDFEGATTLFVYCTSVINTDPRRLN